MAGLRGGLTFGFGLILALAIGWFALPAFLYEKIEQPLQFNHALHAEDAGMACEDCHGFGANGQFLGVPPTATCAECHLEPLGETEAEARMIAEYIAPEREIPWLIYSRQPDNADFPHAQHVRLAELACERCHGPHGQTRCLRTYERNRISGYSRDLWGRSLSRLRRAEYEGMKMSDCSACHREHGVVESCLDCHK